MRLFEQLSWWLRESLEKFGADKIKFRKRPLRRHVKGEANPAGAKILRKVVKNKVGHRVSFAEAAKYYARLPSSNESYKRRSMRRQGA